MNPATAARNRAILIIFVLITAVFTYLAVRSEINDRHIQANAARIERIIRDDCVTNRVQLEKVNHLRQAIIEIEQTSPDFTSPARIRAYTESLMVLPDCH